MLCKFELKQSNWLSIYGQENTHCYFLVLWSICNKVHNVFQFVDVSKLWSIKLCLVKVKTVRFLVFFFSFPNKETTLNSIHYHQRQSLLLGQIDWHVCSWWFILRNGFSFKCFKNVFRRFEMKMERVPMIRTSTPSPGLYTMHKNWCLCFGAHLIGLFVADSWCIIDKV